MKKWIIAFLFLSGLSESGSLTAQVVSDAGKCCQFYEFSCYHPIGLNFADSIWINGTVCLPIINPIGG